MTNYLVTDTKINYGREDEVIRPAEVSGRDALHRELEARGVPRRYWAGAHGPTLHGEYTSWKEV